MEKRSSNYQYSKQFTLCTLIDRKKGKTKWTIKQFFDGDLKFKCWKKEMENKDIR